MKRFSCEEDPLGHRLSTKMSKDLLVSGPSRRASQQCKRRYAMSRAGIQTGCCGLGFRAWLKLGIKGVTGSLPH